MEPFSVVSSVIAVIQLSAKVTSICYEYRREVETGSQQALKITEEIYDLQAVLERVMDLLERHAGKDPGRMQAFDLLNRPDGPLSMCHHDLAELKRRIKPGKGWRAATAALMWPLRQAETYRIIDSIGRSRATICFALTADATALSFAIQNDLESIRTQMRDASLDDSQRRILQWLAAPDPSKNHNEACKKRKATTGSWLLAGQPLGHWKATSQSFLWLYGIPGCGKTILCSTLIEDLLHRDRPDPNVSITYFYFDFNDSSKQTFEGLLRSLVSQFTTQIPVTPVPLRDLYSFHQNGQEQPSQGSLVQLLTKLFNLFAKNIIVIDAMDECEERGDVIEWLQTLLDLKNRVNLLVFSRREHDLEEALGPAITDSVSIQNSYVRNDVRIYLRERFLNDPKLKKWPSHVQAEIEEMLVDGAHGMFRWVSCQLDAVRKCVKLQTLRRTLATLPKTLDETYDRILQNIDEENRDDAFKVLQWLCYAARSVLLEEVIEILALDPTRTPILDTDTRLPEHHDVLTICSTMVSISDSAYDPTHGELSRRKELRLAHFSVKEYLLSDRIRVGNGSCFSINKVSAERYMTETCLAYLLHLSRLTEFDHSSVDDYPLAMYSAEYWYRHARLIDDQDCAEVTLYTKLRNSVLRDGDCFLLWVRLYDLDRTWQKKSFQKREVDIGSPLYYMSLAGLHHAIIWLLKNGADPGVEGGYLGNSLQAASFYGHLAIVSELLEQDADIEKRGGKYGSALQAASFNGQSDVATLLLSCHPMADVNALCSPYGNALQAAAFNGHLFLIELLLKHGAAVNSRSCGQYGHALQAASLNGHVSVMQALIEEGVDVNAKGGQFGNAMQAAAFGGSLPALDLLFTNGSGRDILAQGGQYNNALQAASFSGHTNVVEKLSEYGADVNLQGGHYGNSLQVAALWGHLSVVALLLERGADVNMQNGQLGTALQAAAYQGHEKVVRLLLKSGARINTQCGQFDTALQAAATWGHRSLVEFLLDQGSDIHAQGGHSGSALQAAKSRNHKEVVDLLNKRLAVMPIEQQEHHHELQNALVWNDTAKFRASLKGHVDLDEQGGKYGNPLQAAAFSGNLPMVEFLLEQKVDLKTSDSGQYHNPLQAAALRGHEEIVRLLLSKGLEVNVPGGQYGTPLQAAAFGGHEEIVKLLLGEGAHVLTDLGKFSNPLQAASSKGHDSIVRRLLDGGANIQADGGQYGNALQAASFHGHVSTVRLLLNKGANVHVSGHHYGDALQAAALWGHDDVLSLLLKQGADVQAFSGQLGNALQAAAYHGHTTTLRLLLENGADVQAHGGQFGNALQAAALWGHEPAVRLLLDCGADVGAHGGQYGHALQAASLRGHVSTVELLLERGAEPKAYGGHFGTALLAATSNQHVEVQEILLSYQ